LGWGERIEGLALDRSEGVVGQAGLAGRQLPRRVGSLQPAGTARLRAPVGVLPIVTSSVVEARVRARRYEAEARLVGDVDDSDRGHSGVYAASAAPRMSTRTPDRTSSPAAARSGPGYGTGKAGGPPFRRGSTIRAVRRSLIEPSSAIASLAKSSARATGSPWKFPPLITWPRPVATVSRAATPPSANTSGLSVAALISTRRTRRR